MYVSKQLLQHSLFFFFRTKKTFPMHLSNQVHQKTLKEQKIICTKTTLFYGEQICKKNVRPTLFITINEQSLDSLHSSPGKRKMAYAPNAGRLESSARPEGTAHAQLKVRLSHACAVNLSKFDESSQPKCRIFWRKKLS